MLMRIVEDLDQPQILSTECPTGKLLTVTWRRASLPLMIKGPLRATPSSFFSSYNPLTGFWLHLPPGGCSETPSLPPSSKCWSKPAGWPESPQRPPAAQSPSLPKSLAHSLQGVISKGQRWSPVGRKRGPSTSLCGRRASPCPRRWPGSSGPAFPSSHCWKSRLKTVSARAGQTDW